MTRFVLIAALAIAQAAPAQPIRYENRRISRILPGCGNQKDGCLHVDLAYVEVVSGPPLARERINAAILTCVAGRDDVTPEQYVNRSITDYEQLRKEGKIPAGETWWDYKTVKVLRATAPVFSVEYSVESFEGQVHPFSETRYFNFHTVTGEKVTLASALKDGSMPRLTAVAERRFRKEQQLSPAADLAQAGFRFASNRFQLTDNWAFREKALLFFFNRYEIAPYAMGETVIEIPFDEIRDLLRPGSAGGEPPAPPPL